MFHEVVASSSNEEEISLVVKLQRNQDQMCPAIQDICLFRCASKDAHYLTVLPPPMGPNFAFSFLPSQAEGVGAAPFVLG